MAAGQMKPEGQWIRDERKSANLDQGLKSLILYILSNDQTNSVINCLTTKSTWDALILYHEVLSDVKESKDFQDSPDDEDDTRSGHEYLNDLEEEYQERALSAKSKRFFKQGPTKNFKAKYNKIKAKLALLSSSALAPNLSLIKNKGLIAKTYEWGEEEVSSDENKVIEVKSLMALANEERVSVGKESASNSKWVKISIQKYISEQIPTQKKKILGIDQLIEDTSSSGPKDLVFVKSLAYNLNVSITSSNKPRLSKTKDFTLPNHDISKVPSDESQRNTTNPSVAASDSLAINYDLANESSVNITHLPPLEKLAGAKPVSRTKTIKSILKSNSTFKAKTSKGIT
nr:retrovirus-related Pol polyprotein from transposon TNT 1-94 [Tanacetum cinerariifolium]